MQRAVDAKLTRPNLDGDGVLDLYDAHARELLAFFARRTGDPQAALDLLGDTFLSAFEHRRRCRGTTDRERAAWLFRIAANKLTDYYRRAASERRAIDRLGHELRALSGQEIAAIDQLAEADGYSEFLGSAFEGLSDEQRQALQLRSARISVHTPPSRGSWGSASPRRERA